MAICDHERLSRFFTSDGMKEVIRRLEMFKIYHCLRESSLLDVLRAQECLGPIPTPFINWLKICNGGLLFDTVLLSSTGYDAELDLDFDTFADYNSPAAKEELSLPEGYSVFAVRSYGDPLCFNVRENDGKVYLWNVEQGNFEYVWDDFEAWLTDEVDEAIQLIADYALDPLAIKLEEN